MNQLTPLDITQREFGKVFRGYDPKEVKAFLEEVAQEVERLILENAQLVERIRKLGGELQAFHEREESLKNTLLTAQRLTETLKENARKEAELLIKEAELKADRVLEHAQQKFARIQGEIVELERQKSLFQAKLRSAIKLHLDLLEADDKDVREIRRPADAGHAGPPPRRP